MQSDSNITGCAIQEHPFTIFSVGSVHAATEMLLSAGEILLISGTVIEPRVRHDMTTG